MANKAKKQKNTKTKTKKGAQNNAQNCDYGHKASKMDD